MFLKKYQSYLEASVLESSKRRSLVRRWKDYTEGPEYTHWSGLQDIHENDDGRGVPRTQRHVTDYWNSSYDNLHIPWPFFLQVDIVIV
jgi:hypothetical protein